MEARFETFTVLINRISRNIRKIKNQEMAEYRLRSAHVSCLYYLDTFRSLTSKELCEVCDEDKAAISRSLVFLEKNGYLEALEKDNKKYKRPIELTEKGRIAGKHIVERIDNILAISSEGVSEEERAILYRSLTKISENLQKVCDEYED